MNPASKDIVTLLSNQSSLALTLATDLFFSRMPDQPDDCVAIIDNPGGPPLLALKKLTNNYHYSSVSVQVRNTSYSEGWEVINNIWQFLHGHSDETIDGTYYTLIRAMNDPQVLAYDQNDRVIFLVNFEVQRRST
jgi:hypothetical protein